MKPYIVASIIFAVLSFVTFVAYVSDKVKAINGKRRIPEKVLLSLSLFGGGVGGYIAMFSVRHKTRKAYFHVVNILGIVFQITLIAILAIFVK